MAIQIHNARILTPFSQQNGAVLVQGDRIIDVGGLAAPKGTQCIDARGLYLVPGYIDLHVEGGGGHSVMEGTAQALEAVAHAHALEGATSILPTVTLAPLPAMEQAIDAIRQAAGAGGCSTIAGTHLQGPFLSTAFLEPTQRAHALSPSDMDWAALLDRWEAGLRLVGLSPELPGALAVGDYLRAKGVTAAISHSEASYDQVLNAVSHGFSEVSGLYLTTSTITRKGSFRAPGVTECALAMDEVTVHLAADEKRLPLLLLEVVFRCKGPEAIVLTTGAKLGDQTSMALLVRNMVAAGVSLRVALRMATVNPARKIGLEQQKGRIAPGYDADILLLDEALNVRFCMAQGAILRNELEAI